MMNSLKRKIVFNAKNLIGWKTKRKIIVISVDDYGNVRLDSPKAREALDNEGLKIYSRFDAFDTLETRADLEALYETLTSVKDCNGRHAVFTPFALPCNINFEKMAETGYEEYYYELLPETFQKLSALQPKAYEGAWKLLQEGIEKGLMVPQFHGREHLNLKILKEKLASKDHNVLTALKNRSYTSISTSGYKTISPMAAFEFWEFEENSKFSDLISEGLEAFEKVYGYRAEHFNPPGGREHPVIHKSLKENGIKFLDTYLLKQEHLGKGEYKRVFNYTGKKNHLGQLYLVRNVVFEPTENRGLDWVSYTLKQIEAAFRWNRPAIISSHRVNFCGHIDEENRSKGLSVLKQLLTEITERWPDVEFMAANQLGALIEKGE
ncbi:hypothetical protein NC796_03865 [Aliifodinibius sp. S!AR15-10]|uniref:hypothetical protein n=1 Tax=Aliifodinibius sp. S!AR15-10 TaxID=2950437 RepID=UPI002860D59E|nr:hypothetical protein [Aliifodinibius sp. S!AR15-10]MDR8390263.1 hypothetical protein [Aliifodinibius sp. S!AR15-10]